ncbi:MAG: NAD(P)/FAD-dependent oxidoreductase, partial [Paenibacillus sp.]|nr:NAD(P)/FAD-dependent oxidoreductase [Paenibacillus sp.]
MSKQIVILGGGYGGLLAALTTRKYMSPEEATITVVNRVPSHQIITELHRLAVGNLSEKNVALPLEKLLRGKQINLVVDTVQEISPDKKTVKLAGGAYLQYDALVVALGSETAFFGIPGLQEHSFILKSVNDANKIRAHVEERVAAYSKTGNKADATFVVGGGGLTGIELVGEFADMLPELCRKYGVDYSDIGLYCVEAAPTILLGFAPDLIEHAQKSLEKRGVKFLVGVAITEMQATTVSLKDGSQLETSTLVWTGGVQGTGVVANSGIEVNRG